MKSSLMDRARSLLAAPGAIAAIAAIVPLAATTAAKADVSSWSLGSSSLQYFTPSEYGGTWSEYATPTPTIGSSTLPDGLKIFGNGSTSRGLAPLTDIAFLFFGSDYQGEPDESGSSSRLRLTGSASFAQPLAWDSAILSLPTTFAFGVRVGGGLFRFTEASTGYSAFDQDDNSLGGGGSSGFNTGPLEPGDYGFGFQYVDNFGGTPLISRIDWEINIAFSWSNFNSSDVLALTIPQDSIDIGIVPAPSAAAVLGLAGLVATRRRR